MPAPCDLEGAQRPGSGAQGKAQRREGSGRREGLSRRGAQEGSGAAGRRQARREGSGAQGRRAARKGSGAQGRRGAQEGAARQGRRGAQGARRASKGCRLGLHCSPSCGVSGPQLKAGRGAESKSTSRGDGVQCVSERGGEQRNREESQGRASLPEGNEAMRAQGPLGSRSLLLVCNAGYGVYAVSECVEVHFIQAFFLLSHIFHKSSI